MSGGPAQRLVKILTQLQPLRVLPCPLPNTACIYFQKFVQISSHSAQAAGQQSKFNVHRADLCREIKSKLVSIYIAFIFLENGYCIVKINPQNAGNLWLIKDSGEMLNRKRQNDGSLIIRAAISPYGIISSLIKASHNNEYCYGPM